MKNIFRSLVKEILFPRSTFFVLLLFIIFSSIGYSMSSKPKRILTTAYEYEGVVYVHDEVYWEDNRWNRALSYLYGDATIKTGGEVLTLIEEAELGTVQYERKDLTRYVTNIGKNGDKVYKGYKRKRDSKKIVVVEGDLSKPYVRLGTFSVAGKKPPNLRKAKQLIQRKARFHFGADAAIVENWEIVPFKQEDFFPITKFGDDEYVLYHCIAVAFEETAEIPDYLKYDIEK